MPALDLAEAPERAARGTWSQPVAEIDHDAETIMEIRHRPDVTGNTRAYCGRATNHYQ